jgi:two-component system NtrC family response regulator
MNQKPQVLVVDDDLAMCSFLRTFLGARGYGALTVTNADEAVRRFHAERPAAVLLDVVMPGAMDGLAALAAFKKIDKDVPIIVISGQGRTNTVVQAMKLGATDFVCKPFEDHELEVLLGSAMKQRQLSQDVATLREQLKEQSKYTMLFGNSERMAEVRDLIERVADTDVTVLIRGESGTGKELVARAVRERSMRNDKPFVKVNCAALPTELLESELFGFEKGAFTGAVKQTPGKIESADGGTLFLDEIGDMPGSLQAKLLRFLQQRTIERIGGRAEIPVDVRVLCATYKNLKQAMAAGACREDLYYRICEITIDIPPLREREGGRLLIAQFLLNKFAKQQGRVMKGFTDDGHDAIETYAWPGNVREMENKIKAAVIMAEGKFITAMDLGLSVAVNPPTLNLRVVRQSAETSAIRQALIRASGNISRTAELLGITRPTLYDLMAKYGIRADFVDAPSGDAAGRSKSETSSGAA